VGGPVLGYVIARMLMVFSLWGVFESTFVLFILDHFGSETSLLGLDLGPRSFAGLMYGALLLVGFLLGAPLVGRWSDRAGQRGAPVAVGLALIAVGLVGLGEAVGPAMIVGSVLSLSVAVALINTVVTTVVGDSAPPDARAATMSAYTTLSDVASTV